MSPNEDAQYLQVLVEPKEIHAPGGFFQPHNQPPDHPKPPPSVTSSCTSARSWADVGFSGRSASDCLLGRFALEKVRNHGEFTFGTKNWGRHLTSSDIDAKKTQRFSLSSFVRNMEKYIKICGFSRDSHGFTLALQEALKKRS